MNRYTEQIQKVLTHGIITKNIAITDLEVIPVFTLHIRMEIRNALDFLGNSYNSWEDLVTLFYGLIMALDDEDFDAMIEELNQRNCKDLIS